MQGGGGERGGCERAGRCWRKMREWEGVRVGMYNESAAKHERASPGGITESPGSTHAFCTRRQQSTDIRRTQESIAKRLG